jgi:spore coat protein U domain-containing protein, fimbrial subunit CupE1/2/3/6
MFTTYQESPVKTRILLAVAALSLSAPAFAGSHGTTFNVSSDVVANCSIQATDLDFGNYDPVVANKTTALDVNTSVNVLCTKGAAGVTVGLNLGSHTSAGSRFMLDAVSSDTLQYELYSDSAGGTVWGNAGAGLVAWATFGPIGAGAGVSKTIYGRIPAGQDKSVGHYTDVVTATVNF